MEQPQQLMIFDQVTVICKGCGENRVFDFNPYIVGAASFIEWTKTKLTACACGATHCDLKARFAKDNMEPSKN